VFARAIVTLSCCTALLVTTVCAPAGEAPGIAGKETAPDSGAAPSASAESGGRPVAALPAEIAALRITNARMPAPGLLTGGQINREQMTALKSLGYRTFITLRPADEAGTGWEEEAARTEGVAFERIPVAGEADVTRANAGRLAAALREAGGGHAVVYCASGNRVGALLALQAHYVDGRGPGEALAFGRDAGLTRLEPKVREMLGLPAD